MADQKTTRRERLERAIERSRAAMLPFRKNRVELIREYAGHRYSDNSLKQKQFIAIMAQTAEVYSLALAGSCPQAHISTDKISLRPFAHRFKVNLNRWSQRIRFEQTLQAIVLDAFFGFGVAKICLTEGFETQMGPDSFLDTGFPTILRVSQDDWVHDMFATEWRKIAFAGNRYRVYLDEAQENPRFDKKLRKELKPDSKYGGDEERAKQIASGSETDPDEVDPMVTLWDIWEPRNGTVCTYQCDPNKGIKGEALAEEKWDGSRNGPYRMLGFQDVPDSTIPISPANQLLELHQLANRLMRKISKQSGRQKDVFTYTGGSERDAKALLNADDGMSVRVDNQDAVKVHKMGGVDQGNMATLQQTLQFANTATGNINSLAGLGPSSGTVGQDKMINDAAGGQMQRKQVRVAEFTSGCFEDGGFLLWEHPSLVIDGVEEVGPSKIPVDNSWRPNEKPGDRMGKFLDYQFHVAPYSMEFKSPMDRLAVITGQLQVALPALPDLQQQGVRINWQKYFRLVAEFTGVEEVQEIIESAEPLTDRDGQGPTHGASKPAVTQRTVNRVNQSEATPQGQATVAMQNMNRQPEPAVTPGSY